MKRVLRYFQDLPISRKIRQAIFWTNVAALVLCSAGIIVYELTVTRRLAQQYLDTLAQIVAANASNALATGDASAAEQILFILYDQPQIVSARIFDSDGKPFATYLRPGVREETVPDTAGAPGLSTGSRRIRDFRSIEVDNRTIGTIYLESDMRRVFQRIRNYLSILAGIIVLLMPVVLAIASFLQKIISDPIRELDDIAHQIAVNKKYSVRARVKSEDEIGRLTHTFNQMLGSIEERDRKLVEQADELRRSNKELEQFAYVSSHDLQEPLRKITTYSQLVETKHKGRLDAETDRFLDNIVTSTSRMRLLISNLLTYSRVTRQDLTFQKIDLNQVIKEVLSDMEAAIAEKKADISVEKLPVVRGNAVQMRQLFQNLIGNALKFSAEKPPVVRVSCRPFGDHHVFSVRDNGIGIDVRYAERVFQVFQRLHPRDVYPGTGIGLAICKKIVEQNDGRIWVESEPGNGSTFYFTWPMSLQFV
jgi:signal transduction histidine kinase